jgi:hypothetical protein
MRRSACGRVEGSVDNPAVGDPPPGAVGPIFDHRQGERGASMTGGYVCCGGAEASLEGRRVLGGLASGTLFRLEQGASVARSCSGGTQKWGTPCGAGALLLLLRRRSAVIAGCRPGTGT